MIPLTFGDVFRYSGREYIFLAKTADVIYAAQILSEQISDHINNLYQKRSSNEKNSTLLNNNALYCFVILQTSDYKNRMAHLGNCGKDDFGLQIDKISVTLCREDLKQLKEEIMRKNAAVPLILKELVKDFEI